MRWQLQGSRAVRSAGSLLRVCVNCTGVKQPICFWELIATCLWVRRPRVADAPGARQATAPHPQKKPAWQAQGVPFGVYRFIVTSWQASAAVEHQHDDDRIDGCQPKDSLTGEAAQAQHREVCLHFCRSAEL